MDEKRLKQTSKGIQNVVQQIDELLVKDEVYEPDFAPAFYLLDRFDSDKVEHFVDTWRQGRSQGSSEIPVERAENLVYLVKLHEKYRLSPLQEHEDLSNIFGELAAGQRQDGHIPNHHHDQLRALVEYEPTSKTTERALNYLSEEMICKNNNGKYLTGNFLTGTYSDQANPSAALALMHLDYDQYEGLVSNTIDQIIRETREVIKGESERWDDLEAFLSDVRVQLPERILSISKYDDEKLEQVERLIDEVENICQNFSNNVTEDVRTASGVKIGEITHPSKLAISLLGAGRGPKVPAYQSEWAVELEKQRQRRSRPIVVSTLPTTRLETRRTEIRNKTEEMLNTANEVLRISTLRIDMLHDEIIDITEANPEIEIRILMSTDAGRGPRSRMKKAVKNELIRRTNGQVREDRLNHTRMMIADQNELLISSADLTRDQLNDEFNAGIFTRDEDAISEAIEVFDQMWDKAEHADIG